MLKTIIFNQIQIHFSLSESFKWTMCVYVCVSISLSRCNIALSCINKRINSRHATQTHTPCSIIVPCILITHHIAWHISWLSKSKQQALKCSISVRHLTLGIYSSILLCLCFSATVLESYIHAKIDIHPVAFILGIDDYFFMMCGPSTDNEHIISFKMFKIKRAGLRPRGTHLGSPSWV